MKEHVCSYSKDANKPDVYACTCGRELTIKPDGDFQIEMPDGFGVGDLPEGATAELGGSMTFTQPDLEQQLASAEECLEYWQKQVAQYRRQLGRGGDGEWGDTL